MANILYVATYMIGAIATLILAVYFFREYLKKRLRASLAWAIAFLFYALGMSTDIAIALIGEVSVGKPGIAFGLLTVALSLTLFYYGTAQLFFSGGSFFREKMSVVLFLALIAFYGIIFIKLPTDGFRNLVRPFTELTFLLVFLVIGFLFFRVSQRLPADDPRRQIILLVSSGWFLAAINAFYLGNYLEYSSAIIDAGSNIVHAIGWMLILYGMAIGKAART